MVTLGAIALAVAGHHNDLSVQRITASLLLLPQAEDPIVGVAWTLEHEVLFYAVFAVTIINIRVGLSVCCAWLLLMVIGAIVPMPGMLLAFLASPYHFDFFLGIASAALVLSAKVPMPRFVASFGLVVFLAAGVADDTGAILWSGLLDKALFGLGSCLLIAGVAAAEREGTLRFGRVAEFFGGMSYSLYLVHTTFIGLVAHVLMSVSLIHDFPGSVVATFCIVVAVSGAAAVYAFIEKPMLVKLQNIRKKSGQRIPRVRSIRHSLFRQLAEDFPVQDGLRAKQSFAQELAAVQGIWTIRLHRNG